MDALKGLTGQQSSGEIPENSNAETASPLRVEALSILKDMEGTLVVPEDMTTDHLRAWLVVNDPEAEEYWAGEDLDHDALMNAVKENLETFGQPDTNTVDGSSMTVEEATQALVEGKCVIDDPLGRIVGTLIDVNNISIEEVDDWLTKNEPAIKLNQFDDGERRQLMLDIFAKAAAQKVIIDIHLQPYENPEYMLEKAHDELKKEAAISQENNMVNIMPDGSIHINWDMAKEARTTVSGFDPDSPLDVPDMSAFWGYILVAVRNQAVAEAQAIIRGERDETLNSEVQGQLTRHQTMLGNLLNTLKI